MSVTERFARRRLGRVGTATDATYSLMVLRTSSRRSLAGRDLRALTTRTILRTIARVQVGFRWHLTDAGRSRHSHPSM